MTKATTEDCKKFLVRCFTSNPELIKPVYDDESPYQNSLVEKMWVREYKCTPGANSSYCRYKRYDLSTVLGVDIDRIDASEIRYERCFNLAPDLYEDAIRFLVLEDKDGNLYLGDDVGD